MESIESLMRRACPQGKGVWGGTAVRVQLDSRLVRESFVDWWVAWTDRNVAEGPVLREALEKLLAKQKATGQEQRANRNKLQALIDEGHIGAIPRIVTTAGVLRDATCAACGATYPGHLRACPDCFEENREDL